ALPPPATPFARRQPSFLAPGGRRRRSEKYAQRSEGLRLCRLFFLDEQCAGGFAPAEALDQSRRQQQLEQSREDEQAVARWVHAVTGDAGALAAAEGRRPLEEALQSGEALCDLVNAVWPGQIVGTVRGEAQGGRRLLNITRFVQACPRLGVRTCSRLQTWRRARTSGVLCGVSSPWRPWPSAARSSRARACWRPRRSRPASPGSARARWRAAVE
ncbi:unnamed protein product, partial [Prorocentrum cordatum]